MSGRLCYAAADGRGFSRCAHFSWVTRLRSFRSLRSRTDTQQGLCPAVPQQNEPPGQGSSMSREDRQRRGPVELCLVGDITENASDACWSLLDVPPGGQCIIYFDSPGGSPYTALALASLILMRGLRATGVVAGECSSGALLPFAACGRRLVSRYSVMLFHHVKWRSEENVNLREAAEWARHFAQLETQMDQLLAQLFGCKLETIQQWVQGSRYVTGPELVEAGLAELIELEPLEILRPKRSGRRL